MIITREHIKQVIQDAFTVGESHVMAREDAGLVPERASVIECLVDDVLKAAVQPSCESCVHLQRFELSDAIKTCPVLNIRIHTEETDTFYCSLFEPLVATRVLSDDIPF